MVSVFEADYGLTRLDWIWLLLRLNTVRTCLFLSLVFMNQGGHLVWELVIGVCACKRCHESFGTPLCCSAMPTYRMRLVNFISSFSSPSNIWPSTRRNAKFISEQLNAIACRLISTSNVPQEHFPRQRADSHWAIMSQYETTDWLVKTTTTPAESAHSSWIG